MNTRIRDLPEQVPGGIEGWGGLEIGDGGSGCVDGGSEI